MAPLLAGLGGVVIGTVLGDSLRFVIGAPSDGSLFPAGVVQAFGTAAFVGILFVVGLVLLVSSSTRRGGRLALLLAIGVSVGLVVGLAFGRTYQPSRRLVGEVTVTFTAPVQASLRSTATCDTIANGDGVVAIRAARVGTIGVDDVGIRVGIAPGPTVDILMNTVSAYVGTASDVAISADARTGSLVLANVTSDRPDARNALSGGPVTGSVTWRCGDEAASSVPRTTAPMQGFIALSGVFTTAELRATGECDATQDLRVAAIETVAPWTGGARARISLVPGRQTATITVDPADGTTPETLTSPANLVERRGASGLVMSRSLTATFGLSVGLVSVQAEWECPDEIEGGHPK